jgi:hypothetical protein
MDTQTQSLKGCVQNTQSLGDIENIRLERLPHIRSLITVYCQEKT